MSNKTIIGMTVVVVLICAGVLLVSRNKKEKVTMGVEENAEKQTETENRTTVPNKIILTRPTEGQPTFTEFFAKGGSYECNIGQSVKNLQTNGTMWFSGKDVRADIDTTLQGRTYDFYFIVKDGYTYSWGSLFQGGMKSKSQNADGSYTNDNNYTWNPKLISTFNCKPWKADASMFILPTDIVFKES
jgi:hypothetical protein